MTAGVDLMAAEGSDSAKVLDRNPSDLRGNALSKDRLSIFNRKQATSPFPSRATQVTWQGLDTSHLHDRVTRLGDDPWEPYTERDQDVAGFLSAQSSVSAQPEHSSTRIEEPKSPRLADNPFLKRDSSSRLPISPTDKLSDKSEPSAKSNEDVPRRGRFGEHVLAKGQVVERLVAPFHTGRRKKTTGAAGVDQPRVARSPENSIAAARDELFSVSPVRRQVHSVFQR